MSITNGKESRATPGHPVKALVVIACPEYDHSGRSSVSIVMGGDAIHVARGPWSAHSREVVTIIGRVGCMDTTLKALEAASSEGARFYMVAKPVDCESTLEAWSNGNGQVYGVGVDCDDELPGSLVTCRDEARAITCTNLLAEAFANMGTALSRGSGIAAFAQPVGGA